MWSQPSLAKAAPTFAGGSSNAHVNAHVLRARPGTQQGGSASLPLWCHPGWQAPLEAWEGLLLDQQDMAGGLRSTQWTTLLSRKSHSSPAFKYVFAELTTRIENHQQWCEHHKDMLPNNTVTLFSMEIDLPKIYEWCHLNSCITKCAKCSKSNR